MVIMIKKPEFLKKAASLVLALSFAFITSVAVYATLSYDSSIDPVVSLSGLAQYVQENVLNPLQSSIDDLSARVSAIEISGGGGGGGGGLDSNAYKALIARIAALESGSKEKDARISELESALNSAKDELDGRIDSVENSYTELSRQISSVSDSLTGIRSSIESLKSSKTSMKRDFANLSEKYIAVTKLMNELQSKVDGLTGEGGGVNELREQVKNLQDTWQQLQSKAGVMYRPVFVESGKTVRAKNADEGILVIVRSGYAVIVSPFNTSGTLQGINDLTTGEELYNGADAPLMHNLLIPRGAVDGRGIHIESYDGAYVMIGGEYVIVDENG